MTDEPEKELPPFVIEGARSSRSKCKTCRKAIMKETLRLGILVEGPYGMGHMWHHLECAAKSQFPAVEEAYQMQAWTFAKEEPDDIPDLKDLVQLAEEAASKKKEKKEIPYAEVDPSGRAKCKHSGEPIPKGGLRVVLGRAVTFGSQTRTTPIQVLPEHVLDALAQEDSATEEEGFVEALRQNSKDLEPAQIEALLELIGPLPEA